MELLHQHTKTRVTLVACKVQARGATCIGFLVPFVEYVPASVWQRYFKVA